MYVEENCLIHTGVFSPEAQCSVLGFRYTVSLWVRLVLTA
jgi:hypothetical protein